MADLYLDSDVSIHLAAPLIAHGHRVRTSRDEGKESARDPEQLLFAAEHEWIIVTHNKRDFRLLHVAWPVWRAAWRTMRHHSGILILEQVPVENLSPAVHAIVDSGVEILNHCYEWSATHDWRLGSGG